MILQIPGEMLILIFAEVNCQVRFSHYDNQGRINLKGFELLIRTVSVVSGGCS